MTVTRRLAVLETSLTPTRRVVAWLDEAHALGDLTAYVESLLDQPPEAAPINRLAREAASAARTAGRGRPAEVIDAAVRTALRETIFRYELVMRINVTGHELMDRALLLYTALAAQLALLAGEKRAAPRSGPDHLGWLAQCRDLAMRQVTELLGAQEARSTVEGRYLDGHAALFPDTVAAWAEQLQMAQTLAVMADRLAELDGAPPLVAPADSDAVSRRAAVLVADLVEPARVTALDKLDEGRRATTVATRWLRSKFARSRVDTDADAGPEGPTR